MDYEVEPMSKAKSGRATKIGKIGESEFRKWPSQIDCTVNKAYEDENGWDFLVECLPDSIPDRKPMPLDKIAPPLNYWIQVKSTDDQKRKCAVNLKNWKRLIDKDAPAFFLVFEFDGEDEPQRAFLVHVGEEYIRAVLTRLRGLGSAFKDTLHRKKMSFTYGEQNTLIPLNGYGLKVAVEQYISTMNEYADWKRSIREKAGYEDGEQIVNITIALPDSQIDPLEHLIDFSLGLVQKLKTTKVEVKDIRFGIEAPELREVFNGDGIIEAINHPIAKGWIVFRLGDYSREVRFHADIIIPRGFGFELDKRYRKVRLTAPFINLESQHENSRGKFTFSWPLFDEKSKLVDLFRISQTFLLFEEAKTKDQLIISEIWFEDHQLSSSKNTPPKIIGDPEKVIETANRIESAWNLAKSFDVEDLVEISIAEIFEQKHLLLLNAIIQRQKTLFRVQFWREKDLPAKEIVCPNVLVLRLGKYVMVFTIVIMGNPELTGNENDNFFEWMVTTDNIKLCKRRLVEYQEDLDFNSIVKGLMEATLREFDDLTRLILTDELHDLLTGNTPESFEPI